MDPTLGQCTEQTTAVVSSFGAIYDSSKVLKIVEIENRKNFIFFWSVLNSDYLRKILLAENWGNSGSIISNFLSIFHFDHF